MALARTVFQGQQMTLFQMNHHVKNTHKVGIMMTIYANVSLQFVTQEKLHVMHLYLLFTQLQSARALP